MRAAVVRRGVVAAALLLTVLPVARADDGLIPEPGVPLLNEPVPRGTGTIAVASPTAPTTKVVDGSVDDWIGEPTGFGGTIVRSAGELVYQDHLFDAYGADGGDDAERLATLGPLQETVPETYRFEQIIKMDVASTVGAPEVEALEGSEQYGDLPRADAADLLEARLAADADRVALLARTTTLVDAASTGVLVLVDTGGEAAEREIGFGTGLRTTTADVAFLFHGARGRYADLATGVATELSPGSVATEPSGWTNAIEATVPRALFGAAPRVALATGLVGTDGSLTVANVAFRTGEPVRTWFDKQQALALHAGSIDPFFVDVDLGALAEGATERWSPGPGYHDRIFTSSEQISQERGLDGTHQHYGVFLPDAIASGEPLPMQWWLHWRGGHAHTAGAVIPGMFQDLGENRQAIVVSPRGRGTSSWYVGAGHVDVNEVWADVMARFPVDEDRVTVTGHSMGGWGSYLLSVLYPDRFAAAMPVAGPVTQGAWTGAEVPGCDDMRFEQEPDYTPCYISANDGRPRDQHTRRMLENLRHVPVAILQGAADELVPVSGVTRQVEELVRLGYRHRYLLFPTYEHYSHPVIDEWGAGADYFGRFVRDPNPARVTYRRDMPFERAIEEVRAEGLGLDFSFDRAYWMSELTPVDLDAGVARFDGRSLAIADPAVLAVPEAGGPAMPGQTGPFSMTGLAWQPVPTTPLTKPAVLSNGFSATLNGASAVRLDLARMRITTVRPVTGTVVSDTPLQLRLAGAWAAVPPVVTVNGAPVTVDLAEGVISFPLPGGASTITVG
ncbi:MAG: prolyl oligopeptidase family serine peptidase [Acidimicrobiales bacterium]